MSIENVSTGAGGALITGVLTWLGFKQRLDRADADISELKKAVVFKDVHTECSGAWHRELDTMNKKLDQILEKMK